MITSAREVDRRIRRGMILPLMLLILALLGVMAASSSFYVYANHSAVQSLAHGLQTRLAAEAGVQKVMLMLRTERANDTAWYDNPEEFHRVIVWTQEGGIEGLGTVDEYADGESVQVYRFSIVADDPDDDEKRVRFGITDESSKLNINTATGEQLSALIGQFATEEMNVDALVDALIDWRDTNKAPMPNGAEAEYYSRLDPPYAVKNANYDTVEELLLVRGFSGQLLYGEDFDRNGLLSPNEDDGDESFPPDNGDGELNVGLYPYLTVYSRDVNTASDNTQRVYIFGDANAIPERLADYTDDQDKIDFIAAASRGTPRIKSPAGLLLRRIEKKAKSTNTTKDKGKDKSNDGGQGQAQEETIEVPSPLTLDDMMWVMDRCTTTVEPELIGLINVNTASPRVLATIPELTDEDIAAIVETRRELEAEEKISIGWIAPILGIDTFVAVAPRLTARGTRFRVESLGYGDHIGMITRLETVIEMRGPIAQIIYNRDLTTLGTNYPIRYAEGDADLVGYDR